MSTWQIPAKTFLIGEYLALDAGPAILLTTKPCFELSLVSEGSLPFHPQSPAGRFCRDHQLEHRLIWHDPYHGLGGLGASSAEFIGSFYAHCELTKRSFNREALLDAYWTYAWSNQGKKPSGYDVIAQTLHDCVMIHQAENDVRTCAWPFEDIGFVLVHTRHKLATHEHLKAVSFKHDQTAILHQIAQKAWMAFEAISSHALITAVNEYHSALQSMNLVASTTVSLIDELSLALKPLAIKGCGALGADVVLMIMDRSRIAGAHSILKQKDIRVLSEI